MRWLGHRRVLKRSMLGASASCQPRERRSPRTGRLSPGAFLPTPAPSPHGPFERMPDSHFHMTKCENEKLTGMERKLLLGLARVGIPDYRGLRSANTNGKLVAVLLAKVSPEPCILTGKDAGLRLL